MRIISYVPIVLNAKGGGPVKINAATITGIMTSYIGQNLTTVIRTLDGCEWLVRESPEQVDEAIAAAFTAVNGVPQDVKPLEVTRKGRGEK